MSPEQDQSPKTNLRMFKFDNKLTVLLHKLVLIMDF